MQDLLRLPENPTSLMSSRAYRALVARLGVAPEDYPLPLYVVDRSGRVVCCNPSLAELTGRRVEDVLGKLSLLLFPPEAVPALLMRRVHFLLAEPVAPRITVQMRRRDGTRIPVELTAATLECEGEIVGLVDIVRPARGPGAAAPDVETLLRLTPEEADALPYGLVTLDPAGVVVGYNAAESRLSGLAPGQVIGRNFFLDIAPCTRVRAFAGLYRRMVDTGEPRVSRFDFVFRFSYGEKRVSILMTYSRAARRGAILVEELPPPRRFDRGQSASPARG